MIKDSQANFVYLADILPERYPKFFLRLEAKLKENKIHYGLLPFSKDIWAVDFMPIQVNPGRFVQFKYYPDYLRNSKKWQKTISDVDKICDAIGLEREHSNIVIDGGNVVKSEKSVIMCDKVFRENSNIKRTELIGSLKELLEVERIIFIPQDPEDYLGHADGMVRFIDENTVFVNNYPKDYQPKFQKELIDSLKLENLEVQQLTYHPDYSSDNAFGHYINYLEIANNLFMPAFGEMDLSNVWNLNEQCKADEMAALQLEMAFKNAELKIIDSREIAKDGGVLNCISWKIIKQAT